MLFGLKNIRTIYQKTATSLLHDLMHKEAGVYMYVMIITSIEKARHVPNLQKFFPKLKKHNMCLNVYKCAFEVIFQKIAKICGQLKGIRLDPSKIKPI